MSALFPKIEFPSKKVLFSTVASVAATAMVVRQHSRELLPVELQKYLRTQLYSFVSTFSNQITIVIEEFDGLKKNRLFHAAELYVGTISSPNIKRYLAVLPEKEKNIHVSLDGSEEIADKFCGIHLQWRLATVKCGKRITRNPDEYEYGASSITEQRCLKLTFHKNHKNNVIDEYLPYIVERSEALKQEQKTLKLHTLKTERSYYRAMINPWQSVNLDHPAKFETLAMDDEIKKMIVDDLDRFLKRRELYRKVGKAWKRGYLLFGPPGTGKSSLIAAMSNYLNFDVYDLELTDVKSNSELRKLVISTANRSILVVEDIDASIDLTSNRKNKEAAKPQQRNMLEPEPKITLSGLLNFIDGLWSSCGDERIIIFTTNHKEKLDPALLRPGRMDMHIHMSYCTPCGFRLLASNYHGVAEHPLALKAEELIASSKVTPAEVGEQLLKSDDPELALEGLIKFLELKKEEAGLEHEIKSKSTNELKELMKIAGDLPPEMCEEMLKNDEAANALRFVIGFLQERMGSQNR